MKFWFLGIIFLSSLLLAQEQVSPSSSPSPPTPVPAELLGSDAPTEVEKKVEKAGEQKMEHAPGLGDRAGLAQPGTGHESASSVPIVKEEYVYDPTGRRDPFQVHKSFQRKSIVSGIKKVDQANLGEILDPLLKLDLDKLEVVGIIWEVANPRALVMDPGDPEHRVHIITKRTKIGRNNGYVAAIREGEIVVIEAFEEAGIVSQQPKVIKLQVGK